MQKRKIFILVGTRPNFIKITQFKKVAARSHPDIDIRIIHTGQHFDTNMADVFFRQLNIQPDYFLNVQPAAPVRQIAEIIIKLDDLFAETGKPDLLIVPGDVNSTLAGALLANKSGIKLAHLESGLRSYDRTMPEEFNRVLTDDMSDFFFVTEQSGLDHLKKEGKCEQSIHMVGNTMIDTLVGYENEIEAVPVLEKFGLAPDAYLLMTIHRPGNVDDPAGLQKLIDLITYLSDKYKIVFPIHPRTRKRLMEFGFMDSIPNPANLILTEPAGYFEFQKLVKYSKLVLTDSGGIQEETTYRQKPCLTLRPNTERPVTITEGTNTLLPFEVKTIAGYIEQVEAGTYKKGTVPALWDGKATERIMKILDAGI